ncbi:unnamed protein product [Bursaphelenchus okinawaensis]|uniref:Uncharacterized protein n=1 Tax=Bursaphelenchus okinawaensis TaxID=465554 RepID=A0A811K230_9BILA|nr:unnamed protein product [Bursaphelenchus okinawaensis]CAG9090243.1 unnamed protein product [Bursaphelenchus okinawaensis]
MDVILPLDITTVFKKYIKKRRKCYCNYFVGSELHGLKEAISTSASLHHITWGLLIFLAMCLAIWNTIQMCQDYLANQVETSYSRHFVSRLEFPSVIICPKSPDALNFTSIKREILNVIPNMTDHDVVDLIMYAIADSALVNGQSVTLNQPEEHFGAFDEKINIWKGRRNQTEFYTDLFEKNGYTCNQLFKQCRYGSRTINCCDIFESYYVMLRGRCFRMKQFYQYDPGFYGQLYIGMNELPSLTTVSQKQVQLVAFMATPGSEISTFPRYYLNNQSETQISIKLRMFDLDPEFSKCHNDVEARGRAACYVRQWLYDKFVDPHNCTPFYMAYRAHGAPVCETGLIARMYENVLNLTTEENICMVACSRSEREYKTTYRMNSAPKALGFVETDAYRLIVHYDDLEYENFKEVRIVTLPGFVSQIGGQLGLFLGVTVMSITQILLNLYLFITEKVKWLAKKIWKPK